MLRQTFPAPDDLDGLAEYAAQTPMDDLD